MEEINEYVVLEIETTGLDIEHDYINEMVILKYKDNTIVDSKHYMFEYKDIERISSIYQEFVSKCPVVVHHYSFIKAFLGFEITNKIIDTLKLSKEIYPNLKNHCVSTIGKYLGYNIDKNTDLYNQSLLINEIYLSIKKELLDRKIKTFILNNKDNVNIAIIQRKFIIGYNRAKRLLCETLIKN